MTDAQAQSQFSMWAMVAAPLILGSDPRALTSSTITMLKNAGVIAIDQDSLGAQGYLLSQSGSGQVWVKPLANGDRAVYVFLLSRQELGSHKGCWMTDGVLRETDPASGHAHHSMITPIVLHHD